MFATNRINLPMSQLSPEEEAQLLALRIKAVNKYKRLAISMTIAAVVSIIVGIVIVSSSYGIAFPLSSGCPIWSGLIVLIGAVFGLALGRTESEWKTESDRFKQRCLVIVFYVFAVTSCSFCGLSMVYSIWGAAVCAKENTDKCGTNYTVEVAMNIIGAVTAIFLLVACIMVSIMFCYYRKAFQFHSRKDEIRQMQMIIMQQQQLIAAQNAGQPFQTTAQYASPPTGFGTNWSQAPPPYSETQYSTNNQYI